MSEAPLSFFNLGLTPKDPSHKKFSTQDLPKALNRKRIRARLVQHRSAFGESSKVLQSLLPQAWGEIDSSMSGTLPAPLKDKMQRAYATAISQVEAWTEIARLLEDEFGLSDRY